LSLNLLEGESQNTFLDVLKSNVLISNSNIESLVKIEAKDSDIKILNSSFSKGKLTIFEIESTTLDL